MMSLYCSRSSLSLIAFQCWTIGMWSIQIMWRWFILIVTLIKTQLYHNHWRLSRFATVFKARFSSCLDLIQIKGAIQLFYKFIIALSSPMMIATSLHFLSLRISQLTFTLYPIFGILSWRWDMNHDQAPCAQWSGLIRIELSSPWIRSKLDNNNWIRLFRCFVFWWILNQDQDLAPGKWNYSNITIGHWEWHHHPGADIPLFRA